MGLFSFFKRNKKVYEHVIEVGDDNFDIQVLQRSYKTPIMVDYWAAWCVPCRQFGPVLERVAMEPESGFLLAKVNTEHNPRTAARFNIQGIPAIKIFRNGRVIHEFTGMRLEHQVREMMAQVITAAAPTPHLNLGDNPAQRLKQAKAYLRKGKGFHAAVCLQDFPEGKHAAEAEQLLPLAEFLWDTEDGDVLTGSRKVDDALLDAADAFDAQNYAEALTHLEQAAAHGREDEQNRITAIIEALKVYAN